MDLNNFKLLKEHHDKYEIQHPKGSIIHVKKDKLSEQAHKMIKKMACGGEVKGYKDGGEIEPIDKSIEKGLESISQDANQPAGIIKTPEFIANAFERTPVDQGQYKSSASINPEDIASFQSTMSAPSNSMMSQIPQAKPQAQALNPSQFIPGQPTQPVQPQSGVQSSGMQGTQQNAMMNPFSQMESANLDFAKAIQGEQQQNAKNIQAAQKQINALPTEQQVADKYNKSGEQLANALVNQKIDPNRVWNNTSTGGKISAGIGLLLGGIGAGLTHQPSMAMQIMDNAINKDIEAQRSEQEKTKTLWSMNRQALGSDLAANMATKQQYLTVLQHQIMSAAANSKSAQALAQAKLANAGIEQQKMMLGAQLGLNAGLHLQAGDGTEEGFIGNMNAASRFAPDIYKDVQSKYIPSVGVAKIPLTAEDRSEVSELDSLGKDVNRAISLQSNFGVTGAWSPEARAEANAVKDRLRVSLGHLFNLKRLNDREYDNYSSQVGNIGGINAGGTLKTLQELQSGTQQRQHTIYNQLGITPFKTSNIDNIAIQWAKQAPANDPRAQTILRQAGGR